MSGFGITHLSGLSVGWDPARTDYTPDSRGAGAVISIGTQGTGINRIVTSVQSADIGGLAASQTSEVQLLVTNVRQNDLVLANPWSQWSGVAEGAVVTASAPSDHSVYLNFSNTSDTALTLVNVNWNIIAIGF
jgi:hypothetical protein